jgi:hypothetical protein
MLSESARMTTAHEAGFRIQEPNSKQRSIKVIALDKASAVLVDQIAKDGWRGASFFTSLSFVAQQNPQSTSGESVQAWLNDLAGRTMDLMSEVANSDFVVVVTCAGEDARAVTVIADACAHYHKSLLSLVVPQEGMSEADVEVSLKHLRPHSRMLVVAKGIDYIEVMLSALRAA